MRRYSLSAAPLWKISVQNTTNSPKLRRNINTITDVFEVLVRLAITQFRTFGLLDCCVQMGILKYT
jgi:hypothetical protein